MSYFNGKISKGFFAIYSGRMVLRASGALMGLFLPIFLYELFDFNIKLVFIYYLVGYISYAFFIAWGVQYLNKIGLRRSLRISLIWGSLFYFVFYLIQKLSNNLEWTLDFSNKINILLLFTIIVLTLQRIMYWTPLHTDLAKFTDKKNRAKQLSLLEATSIAIGAVMPLLAGWILLYYNYDVLFFMAVIIYLIAFIPFMKLPRTREKFSWTYAQTWKKLFSPKRRNVVFAYIGDGAESVVGIIIWPIFIWELLNGDYFQVGMLSSLIVVVTVFLQLLVGKFADNKNKKNMLKYGSCFYAVGWVVKIFIATAFHIFIVSAYHNLAKIFTRVPFDALTYEKAADQGHYVDEYTVIHEIAIQIGKILMIIFALILVSFLSIEWTFILAAFASLTMNFLAKDNILDSVQNKTTL